MSSVPCARERAELVRAWWVTASGSGVAICGDTGKKLDRSVPAGFETVPQGIRVNLRVRDASGITTPLQIGHDVRRASRTPLIAPGRKPVEGFVLTRLSSPFHGEVDRRQAARRRGAASAAKCLRHAPLPPGAHAPAPSTPPSPRLWRAHFPTLWGRKRECRFPRIYSGAGVSGEKRSPPYFGAEIWIG